MLGIIITTTLLTADFSKVECGRLLFYLVLAGPLTGILWCFVIWLFQVDAAQYEIMYSTFGIFSVRMSCSSLSHGIDKMVYVLGWNDDLRYDIRQAIPWKITSKYWKEPTQDASATSDWLLWSFHCNYHSAADSPSHCPD